MWLKMCPKCGGDLYLRDEIDGKDVVCLQCGHTRPADSDEGDTMGNPDRQLLEKRAAA
jgi:DNA-directed RNA polymerase subunit M/transcription elongation factor TFIIS